MYWIIIAISLIAIFIGISIFVSIINKKNNKSKADSIISILLKSNDENFKKCLENIIMNINMNDFIEYIDEGDKYNAMKDYINQKFKEEAYNILIKIINDSLQKKEITTGVYTTIIKTLTHDMVDDYIIEQFENLDIKDSMIDLYNKCLDKKINNIELEDNRINEEFWLSTEDIEEEEMTIEAHNQIMDNYINKNHLEDMNNFDYRDDNGNIVHGDDGLFTAFMPYEHKNIIPPKETESDIIEDDGSIEIIEYLEDK